MDASDYPAIADRFGAVVDSVNDWDAPTPVPEWRARDIVDHLTTWLPGLLGSCGVEIPMGTLDDPVGSWRTQDAALRSLLADRGGETITHEFLGTKSIAEIVAQVYLGDVFMHTWDLARSAGVDDGLDPAVCEEMVTGMEQMEDMLRNSGHYGPRFPGDPGPDPVRRLMAFVGRDPNWSNRA
ncbi:MAG: maleylpyruvate isomerase N-terminal domain-containing protein [Acidimicrobiales bacterium]